MAEKVYLSRLRYSGGIQILLGVYKYKETAMSQCELDIKYQSKKIDKDWYSEINGYDKLITEDQSTYSVSEWSVSTRKV